MGTNTENGIQIFGITIPIYLNIRFGRSSLCRFRSFLCPGTRHIARTYTDTVTSQDQLEVQKLWSGVSSNYSELGSLYMLYF